MKKTRAVAAVLLFGAALFLPSCSPKKAPPPPVSKAERTDLQGQLEKRLQEIGRELDALAAQANKATGRARENLNEALAQLKEKQRVVAQNLDEMRRVSGDAWDKARANVEQALDDLKKAFDKARAPEKEK